MKNKQVIDEINSFVEQIEKQDLSRRDIVEFNLQDIQTVDNFRLGDSAFSERASKNVLNILNAKPSFIEFQSLMEKTDWNQVANKIKSAKGDINLYGSLIQVSPGTYEIDNIFFKNPKKKNPDDLTRAKAVIETITDTLSRSNVDWDLQAKGFDEESAKFMFQLQNSNNAIEVLKNDFWKQGQLLEFNSTEFLNSPFFERLVCTNGMTRPQYGWRSNIAKASFNNQKLEKAIQHALSEDNTDVAELITGFANHMKNTTISLREFLIYKNFFEKRGYDEITAKYFNEAPFFKAWGENIDKKPKGWKATANTNINAYDFINMNTWLASHTKESGMTEGDAKALKIAITDLFVKKELDCEVIAPVVKVEYPHFAEME